MGNLADIGVGEGARVRNPAGSLGQRLRDLGFTKGASVQCLFAAPGRGMRAYRVRGAVIALRQRDAKQVETEDAHHG